MIYTTQEIFSIFHSISKKLFDRNHLAQRINLFPIDSKMRYIVEYRINKDDTDYIPPACYILPPDNQIVLCLEIINNYVRFLPSIISDLFVKYLLIHESFHSVLYSKYKNIDEEEIGIEFLMFKKYTLIFFVGSLILVIFHKTAQNRLV